VPASVSPQREDKKFGTTDTEWPLVAEMQQRLQADGVRVIRFLHSPADAASPQHAAHSHSHLSHPSACMCHAQRYGTRAVEACFKSWGGEARCLLRVLRANFYIVDDAMTQCVSCPAPAYLTTAATSLTQRMRYRAGNGAGCVPGNFAD
jgi:hypothetical protein